MDVLKICIIGIASAALALVLRQHRPEYALMVTIAAAVLILFIVADHLSQAADVLLSLGEKTGISDEMLSSVLKIIGVGYITEFSAGICEDSGNKSIGDKISLGGKVLILVVALPVLSAVIDIISKLIN